MSESLPAVIAIDGPSASGKSTVASALARRFGYRVIDTGMTYRAFTLTALARSIPADDVAACEELARTIDLVLEDERVTVDGQDVTGRLREQEVEANVSAYSAIPGVREAMVAIQREAACAGLAVVVGRDIGTVVFPGAQLKFFLLASEEARAERRSRQANVWGQSQDSHTARRDISGRDSVDSTRAVSPTRPAEDAIVLDTTDMTLDDLVATVENKVAAWHA